MSPESTVLAGWIAVVSLLGLVEMGIDKLQAVGRRSRIRERTLWLTAFLGGFPGILVGGFVLHHKTSKAEFWAPVAVSALLWAAAIVLILHPSFLARL